METRLRLTALSLAVCALAGCGDGTGPSFIEGDFSLTEVNGAPPPVLVEATINCDGLIATGTLTLGLDGGYSILTTLVTDCTRSGGGVSNQFVGFSGTYSRSGKSLLFQIPGTFPISATYANGTVTGTIPVSLGLFATDVDLTFAQVVP